MIILKWSINHPPLRSRVNKLRNDVPKVICEKARKPIDEFRSGRIHHNRLKGGKFNRRFTVELEHYDINDVYGIYTLDVIDSPQSAPMNRHAKSLTDHLGVIKGWIRKQLGRNWNDSMKEFHSQFKRKYWLQEHVYSHISDFIFLPENVTVINEKLYGKRFKKGSYQLITEGQLYADPLDNIVKWGKEERSSKNSSKYETKTILCGAKIDSLPDDYYTKTYRHIGNKSFKKDDNGTWTEVITLSGWKSLKKAAINWQSPLPVTIELVVDEKTKKRYKLN